MRSRLRQVGYLHLLLALASVLWLVAPLRFEDPFIHQVVCLFSIGCALWGLLGGAITLPSRNWMRVAISIPIGIFTVLYPASLFLSMVGGGPISGYELISTAHLPGSSVVAYRVNGGATTDYQIRVYHKKTLLPGLALARQLHSGYHESQATLEITGVDSVRATIRGGLQSTEYSEDYRLRRNVIF